MKTLIVVDMQNDFIDGALANPAAQAIVEPMVKYIEQFTGEIIYTRDTHFANYLDTQEGKNLPVVHCLNGTQGWRVRPELIEAACHDNVYWSGCVDKMSFGDVNAIVEIMDAHSNEIYICGTCTDICVVSNALLLKADFYFDADISVDATCCAGVTPETHEAALKTMEMCQINVKRG